MLGCVRKERLAAKSHANRMHFNFMQYPRGSRFIETEANQAQSKSQALLVFSALQVEFQHQVSLRVCSHVSSGQRCLFHRRVFETLYGKTDSIVVVCGVQKEHEQDPGLILAAKLHHAHQTAVTRVIKFGTRKPNRVIQTWDS